jgi:riboflavin synthase
MFTGIVTELGRVRKIREGGALTLQIAASKTVRDLKVGDSVAVNGVCLTATKVGRTAFWTQAVPETLGKTTLGSLKKGSVVNLELAARLRDRLGGHLVQGHVDGRARAISVTAEGASHRIAFSVPGELARYLVPKGSVTVDGASLTVADVSPNGFEVVVIPHTLEMTTLGKVEVGHEVNIEVDILAKYTERLLEPVTHPR